MKKERIILGSGTLYNKEFTGSIPEDADIETEANRFGRIKGGCTIEYTSSTTSVKDDLGKIQKTIVTEEEAKLKTGIISVIANYMEKLISTGRLTTSGSGTSAKNTLKIGGLGNDNRKSYLWRFVHTDAVDGDIRLTIVGKNTGGFTLNFQKDNGSQVDIEITAEPSDSEGTLIIYEEEVKVEAGSE